MDEPGGSEGAVGLSSRRVVRAALAAHSERRDQLGGDQPIGVAVGLKLPRPVVRPEHAFLPITPGTRLATIALSLVRAILG